MRCESEQNDGVDCAQSIQSAHKKKPRADPEVKQALITALTSDWQ